MISPLSIAEREHRILKSDKEKFIHYINHLENKRQKLLEINARLADELQNSDDQLKQMEHERKELKEIVDNQKISPADVARMTAEQEQLSKLIAGEMEREAEASKLAWEQEVVFQRQADELEKTVNEYHTMAHQLLLIPETAENAKGRKFQIELTLHAQRGHKMSSIDLRKEVYLRADKQTAYHGYNDEKNLKLEALDALTERCKEMISDVEHKVAEYETLEEQIKIERAAVAAEKAKSDEEIRQYERDTRQVYSHNKAECLRMNGHYQQLCVTYNNLVHTSNERRKATGNEAIRIIDELIA
ncbi:hypothetical protein SYNPS1DRAFT_24996, partial [Syncephalis pseudoplumigaleata]